MISDARRGHVSPGIYTEEKDVLYSVKSLGITSLGLVGETLYGPAFQNVEISDWGEFVDYFGGTSPEKFKNGNLKYELPYVAKEYLEESRRLNVVRVLGLSGYQAGKPWIVWNKNMPVLVLRSKMAPGNTNDDMCTPASDNPTNIVTGLTLNEYQQVKYDADCKGIGTKSTTETNENKFQIIVSCAGYGYAESLTYNVSLNPADSDYIYNVIGNRPDNGTAPIYVEALYESHVSGITVTGAVSTSTTISSSGISLTSAVEENSIVYNFCDFKEAYRAAQTPWIVSDAVVKESGGTNTAEMRKLFKFITISDGDAANFQVKVSIQNIDVENGIFDVVVRDFNDTDANPIILESFRKCNLVEGDGNYIAARIGSSDGGYESKSKYICVEMAPGEDFGKSIPAGFLGYPMPNYGNSGMVFDMKYNTEFDSNIRAKKQYFGISNLAGIDRDVFTYKGKDFYNDEPTMMTKGFHMDSVISGVPSAITKVDNISGYSFTCVNGSKVSSKDKFAPRLINAPYINETLYSDINTRKFTVCFYGGFDGWDLNRGERSNTDEYKSTKYNISGSSLFEKYNFDSDTNLPLNLPNTAITSDYYAYLAGCRVFANPQDIDINIFATPGINWWDNSSLTEEIIDMIEDSEDGRGGDALYIISSPEASTAQEVIEEFKTSEINSSYACTYFPWIMYYDTFNKRYVNLPVTKDVVRNMAAIDNNSYSWFAPAGTERGKVKCIKAAFKTRLSDEDALYEAGINPVKSFAQDGVIIWGNKTAYPVESPLNRINVRRLMIRVKKLIKDAAKHLIFEQYDETLEKQFRNIVEPILADVKANRGIIDYRVITECTPETRDQHILPAKILVKPVQSLEYISISFTVYPESISFEE